jgi:hypothetical protein
MSKAVPDSPSNNFIPTVTSKTDFFLLQQRNETSVGVLKNKSANISNWQMIRTWQSHRQAGSWTSKASQFHPSTAPSCSTILSSQRRFQSCVLSGKLSPFFILNAAPPAHCTARLRRCQHSHYSCCGRPWPDAHRSQKVKLSVAGTWH